MEHLIWFRARRLCPLRCKRQRLLLNYSDLLQTISKGSWHNIIRTIVIENRMTRTIGSDWGLLLVSPSFKRKSMPENSCVGLKDSRFRYSLPLEVMVDGLGHYWT